MAEVMRFMVHPLSLAIYGVQILMFLVVKFMRSDYGCWHAWLVANLILIAGFVLVVVLVGILAWIGLPGRGKKHINKNAAK